MHSRYGRRLALVLIVGLLPGCLDVETTVRVDTHGGGEVHERVLLNKRVIAPLRAMAESLRGLGGESGDSVPLFNLLDRDRLEARARAMGDGVRLAHARETETHEGEGYVARYTFSDIRSLRINQNPRDRAPAPGRSPLGSAGDPPEFITFDFTPGDEAELVIRLPVVGQGSSSQNSGEEKGAGSPSRAAVLEQMRSLFRGLEISLLVEVLGEVVETNASHHEAGRITLMSVDFERLLGAAEKLEALADERPRGLEALKKWLADVPGVTVETGPEVRVRFRDYGLRAI